MPCSLRITLLAVTCTSLACGRWGYDSRALTQEDAGIGAEDADLGAEDADREVDAAPPQECIADIDCDDSNPDTLDRCADSNLCTHLALIAPTLESVGRAGNTLGAGGQSIWANNDFAVLGLTGAAEGIQLFDISNKSAPSALGSFRTDDGGPADLSGVGNDVLAVDVVGTTAYLATYYGGLVLVDISNPTSPSFLGAIAISGESWSVQVTGDLAYVGNHSGGVVVVDVSTPSAPVEVASLPLVGNTQDLHVDGDRIYAASKSDFQLVSISNPIAPVLLDSLTTGALLYEVWAPPGGPAFVIDKSAHTLLEIAVDGDSVVLTSETTPSATHDYRSITGSGGNLYVGLGTGDVGSVRSYGQAALSSANELAASGRIMEITSVGDWVVSANLDGQIEIFHSIAP